MTRFMLTLEFDGRPFVGWQRQAHGASVQQTLEEAAARITGEKTIVYAAGRTDAGVHAVAMRAHIDIAKDISAFRLMEALNARLRPAPIAVLACEAVADDWHARFSCTGRVYEYHIINRRAPLTWSKGLCWQIAKPLDTDAMHEAAQHLVGQHDFTTFRSSHCQAKSPIKTLHKLEVSRIAVGNGKNADSGSKVGNGKNAGSGSKVGNGKNAGSGSKVGNGKNIGSAIIIKAAAPSFLHHQIRSMIGCLVLVGHGKWSADDLKVALRAADRRALGLNAPPDGLYFVAAHYA